jgi:hypothetical protein
MSNESERKNFHYHSVRYSTIKPLCIDFKPFILFEWVKYTMIDRALSFEFSLSAGSRYIHVLILKYITLDGQTLSVFALTHSFNVRYAVKHPFFAPNLAICRAQAITNPTIHSASF